MIHGKTVRNMYSYFKIRFDTLVPLVAVTIEIYYDARPCERQILGYLPQGKERPRREAYHMTHLMPKLRVSEAIPPFPLCLHEVRVYNFIVYLRWNLPCVTVSTVGRTG
jgi:hypothetical protein